MILIYMNYYTILVIEIINDIKEIQMIFDTEYAIIKKEWNGAVS